MATYKEIDSGWRVQICVLGVRDSGSFPTKAKARAWASMRETEIRTQNETGILAKKTLDDACDRYVKEVSPKKRRRVGNPNWESHRLTAFRNFLLNGERIGELQLVNVTPDVLGRWRDERIKTVKSSTINRDLNLISNMLIMAQKEWKWMAHRPTADVKRLPDPEGRDRRVTEAEVEQMHYALGFDGIKVATASQRVAIAFSFAIETAMRAGEICALRKEWIVGAVAKLPGSVLKNGLKRDVPLSKRALELLALLPVFEEGEVFGLTSSSLDALFRKARGKTLIEGMTFHDSRHEAITRLARKLDILPLARMVGHRDLKMLLRYYNESAEDMAPRLG